MQSLQIALRRGISPAACAKADATTDAAPPGPRAARHGPRAGLGQPQVLAAAGVDREARERLYSEGQHGAGGRRRRRREELVLFADGMYNNPMAEPPGGGQRHRAHQIGSLEVGKQADLILVDLQQPNLSPILQHPIRNIVPNLVYAGTGHEVTTVMVAGKVIVEDGVVLTVDEAEIVAEAQKQAEIVAAKVAADPVHTDMALLANMVSGEL